ncbi:MAG: glycerate kinase [Chloroflexi bacterium]|nr:glycerate kinase [Chloroflexota bacterium]
MRVLIAPDSFKGSLSSVEVAEALAEGWRRERPDDETMLAPLADGGEGTLEAIAATGSWKWEAVEASDPIGRPVTARWLRSADGTPAFDFPRAVVELASASGLSRLALDERDPFGASTRGTGEVIRAVLDAGVRRIVLGIGGSATTDGGRGILEALGARVRELPGGAFEIDLSGLDPRLADTELRIACDVTNPLLGERGAAATYGPQKGADPGDVEALDARLTSWADALEGATARRERGSAGAGAAGGTAFGLLSIGSWFRRVELVPGVDLVVEEIGLEEMLAEADLVITGEGRIDSQTAFGKTALGVARLAQAARVRCVAVGGGVEPEGVEALGRFGVTVVPVWEQPVLLAQAMAAGSAPLVECGARMARGWRGDGAFHRSPDVVCS